MANLPTPSQPWHSVMGAAYHDSSRSSYSTADLWCMHLFTAALSNTPLTAALSNTPLTAALSNTPLTAALSNTPLTAALSDTPLTAALSDTPLTAALSNTPLTAALSKTPLTAALSNTPLTAALSNTPLTAALSNTPLTAALSNTPLTAALSNTPLTAALSNTPLTAALSNTPLTAALSNTPLTAALSNTPLTAALSNTPLTAVCPGCSSSVYIYSVVCASHGLVMSVDHCWCGLHRSCQTTHPEYTGCLVAGPSEKLLHFDPADIKSLLAKLQQASLINRLGTYVDCICKWFHIQYPIQLEMVLISLYPEFWSSSAIILR